MRIAAYCRVSTAKEEQLDSLAHQKEFFQAYAQRNGYELVKIYADEGISGTRLQKREQFQALLHDAKDHRFELVVVKDISRFARNTVDFLQSVRALKELGVNTRFLTADMDSLGESEFVLTVFGALAQEESANLSKRVKFGKKLNAQKGRVPRCIYGYDRIDNFTLQINQAEADVVRLIYQMYVEQGLGCRTIAQQLDAWGYGTKQGCGWTPSAVHRILTNPIYCGHHVNHKYEVENYLTGRQRKLLPQEQYHHLRPQWAIVTPEQFEQAQAQRKARSQIQERDGHEVRRRYSACHAFSGLMICQECGRSFCRKTYTYAHTRIYWKCAGNDQGLCENRTKVEENQLLRAIAGYVMQGGPPAGQVEERLVHWALEHRDEGRKAADEWKRLERKEQRYAQLYANEAMTLEDFLEKRREIQARILTLQSMQNKSLLDVQQAQEWVRRQMDWREMTRTDMARLVERITVDGEGEVRVIFCRARGEPTWLIATVEAVDPIILSMKLVENCENNGCSCSCGCDPSDIPPCITSCFPGELSMGSEGKRVYVTLGQFSLIRLERDSQLLIPAYDYCIPSKECTGGSEEDPCALFRKVQFPTEEFFPPNTVAPPEGYQEAKHCDPCCQG